MKTPKPILVVPKASITPETRKEIIKAGYIVVETDDPEKAKVIGELDSISSDILMASLLETVGNHQNATFYTLSANILKRINKKIITP